MNGDQAKWAERVSRFGLLAKGIVYMTIGGLTAMAAFGFGGKVSDRDDAFNWIIDLPFGRILLGIVAAGLLAYVFWRFIQVYKDPENKGNDFKGIMQRTGITFSGLAYGALAYYAAMLAIEGPGSNDGDGGGSRQFIVAKLLQQPAGQYLVGAVAVFFVGLGIYQIYKSLSGKYKKKVNQAGMSGDEKDFYLTAGRLGYIARGIVLCIIGFLFYKAAVNSNPSEADGTGGAFQFLQNSGYGPWLLGVVAVGLFLYGVFCLVQARYRTIRI